MPEKQVGKRIPEKELVEHWQILGSLWFAVITSDTVVGMQGEKGQQSQVTLIASSQQGRTSGGTFERSLNTQGYRFKRITAAVQSEESRRGEKINVQKVEQTRLGLE